MGQTCCSSHLFAMLLGACRRCGALILRGRTGEASDRTRRAGEPRCPMFEMLQTEEGVL